MAFCMGLKSSNLLKNSKKPPKSMARPVVKPTLENGNSPTSYKRDQQNAQRDEAAKAVLDLRKHNSFRIQTSAQQTRFSKKDLSDLKNRFVKYSNQILVDENGQKIKEEKEEEDKKEKLYGKDNYISDQESGKSGYRRQTSMLGSNVVKRKAPLGAKYKKIGSNITESPDKLGVHCERRMSKKQFRECMGLLGLESNSFLSDRIFEVVDSDKDEFITFEQFLTIMDTLINGEEDEKHEFSFALLDQYDTGYIDFEEFTEVISKIIAHWCVMTGSQVKVDKEALRELFERMDVNGDGIVDLNEYKSALKDNPQLFGWFELLNQGSNDTKKAQKDINKVKLEAASDILKLQYEIDKVMNKVKSNIKEQQQNAESLKPSSHYSNYYDTSYSQADMQQRNQQKSQERRFLDLNQNSSSNQLFNDIILSSKTSKEDKEYLQLKNLISPFPRCRPQSPQIDPLFMAMENEEGGPWVEDQEQRPFDSKQINSSNYNAKHSQVQTIKQIKYIQDIHRQRKREMGEKKALLLSVEKKTLITDSSDSIEDPESFSDNRDGKSSNRYSFQTSPLIKLYKEKRSSNLAIPQEETKTKARRSNSYLTPNCVEQQAGVRHKRRSQKPRRSQIRQQKEQNLNEFMAERVVTPPLTIDATRSDYYTTAQEGRPMYSCSKPVSEISRKQDKERASDNGKRTEVVSPNNDHKTRQSAQNEGLMDELSKIQNMTQGILSKLGGTQDQDFVKELNTLLENQRKNMIESSEVWESNLDQGLCNSPSILRPQDEIEQFFKTKFRKKAEQDRNSSSKKSVSIHKPLSKNATKSFIHIGHDNWNLVLHMMMGVRQSVRNVMHEEAFELVDQDFERKYCYELIAKKTKNMRLFEFYDFSPRVFHLIRTMYGITPDSYLKSIGPENLIANLMMGSISSLKEQCSTGKSGSFFYYTSDSLFMLKTISVGEFQHLKEILKDYYEHLSKNPHSLITRFYGLHKIKYSKSTGKHRIYFVIMANVFKTTREINVRYDLKGSIQGRRTKTKPDEQVDSSVALKDLDFLNQGLNVKIDFTVKKALIKQIQADVQLFQKLNINDYSLLLGIHYLQSADEADLIIRNSPNVHDLLVNSLSEDENVLLQQNKNGYSTFMSPDSVSKRPLPFFEAQSGGIISRDKRCIYYFGIIDTLTVFGTKKKLEYHFKSVRYGSKISCIPPKAYGERFFRFMNDILE